MPNAYACQEGPCTHKFDKLLNTRERLSYYIIISRKYIGDRTCILFLVTIVNPWCSMRCMMSRAFPAATASGLINAKVFSTCGIVSSSETRPAIVPDVAQSARQHSDLSVINIRVF